MTNKRTERKNTKPTKKVVAARPSRVTKKTVAEAPKSSSRRAFDYFRASESYTSLILGIVVVIITSILLIAFLRNRTNIVPQSTKDISTAMKIGPTISLADSISEAPIDTVSKAISQPVTPTVTPVAKPTVVVTTTPVPTVRPTGMPTVIPTKVVAKATTAPTTVPTVKPTVQPTVQPTAVANTRPGQVTHATTYTTKAGDDLWAIAEKYYKSGYNWVDIAKANNIANGDVIYSGMKLKIPAVERKLATVTPTTSPTAMSNLNKPGNQARTYTVKAGDDLWDVAIAVYKDGYRWSEIAKANNLTNPNVIHSGNVLKIP